MKFLMNRRSEISLSDKCIEYMRSLVSLMTDEQGQRGRPHRLNEQGKTGVSPNRWMNTSNAQRQQISAETLHGKLTTLIKYKKYTCSMSDLRARLWTKNKSDSQSLKNGTEIARMPADLTSTNTL
jgi:hypothetical protein